VKPWILFSVAAIAACSGGATSTTITTPTPPPDAAPAPVFEPAAMLRGAWTGAAFGTTVTWLRPGRPDGAIYGVALSDPPAVWVIDDVDERLQLTVYEPGATDARVCDHDLDQPEGLWFACDDDTGGSLRFVQNGDLLDYEIVTNTTGPFTFHHSPADAARAPDAEAADRGFDHADITADGLDGLALEWTPTASTLAPEGTLAATAGTFHGSDVAISGTYATVWRKEPDGWRAIFDVGRTDH
jgi:hypothetical protein